MNGNGKEELRTRITCIFTISGSFIVDKLLVDQGVEVLVLGQACFYLSSPVPVAVVGLFPYHYLKAQHLNVRGESVPFHIFVG